MRFSKMDIPTNQNTSNVFRTRDLNEAAAVLASGVKFLRLEEGQGFYFFVFEDKDTQTVSDRFWAGDLLVNAKKFSDALRTLKDRLFARR